MATNKSKWLARLDETPTRREEARQAALDDPYQPTHRIYKPTRHELANPPAEVTTACLAYGHQKETFWCYRHGEFCIKWELRDDSVDWATCQCPECINQGTTYGE